MMTFFANRQSLTHEQVIIAQIEQLQNQHY